MFNFFIIIMITFGYMTTSYSQEKIQSQTILITADEIPNYISEENIQKETLIHDSPLLRNKSTTAEVLRYVPGVSVFNQGGSGKVSRVFIRGTNSEHTLVLVDGVEVNDPMSPGRAFDFAHLDLNSVEKIEVIKGPQSVVYGSDALGGVINIITKKGSGPLQPKLKVEGGSYGEFKIGLEASGGNNNNKYNINLSHKSADGFSSASEKDRNFEKDGYKNLDITAKFNNEITNKIQSELVLKHISAKNELDRNGGPGADDPNAEESVKLSIVKLQLTSLFFKEKLESSISINYSQTNRKNKNYPDLNSSLFEDDFFKGQQIKSRWNNKYLISNDSLINFGLDYETEKGETNKFSKKNANSTGFFLRYNKKWMYFFSGAGLRHSRHSENQITSTTYQLNAGIDVKRTETKLSTNLATGFKNPSLFFLYDSQFGNLNLKPEEVISWDISLEQNLLQDTLSLNLVYFENNFSNLISFDPLTSRSINLGKSKVRGAEVGVRAQLNSQLKLNLGASHLFQVENTIANEDLIRRPKNTMTSSVIYSPTKKIDITASYRYTGRRDDFEAVTFNKINAPSFDVVDLTLDYNFKNDNRFFVRCNNLLDREYEEIDGFGTAGLSLYTGMSFNF